MSAVKELPELVTELAGLSRDYLREEALGPARRFGKLAGFRLGAAALFALGGLLLAVAGLRWLTSALPETWDWAGYVGTALASAVVGMVVLRLGRR